MTAPLPRTIGTFGLTASIISVIIGSSIFVFPATVARGLGAAGMLAYVVAAVLMALIALCFAESGSRITGVGGAYAYVEGAFGPLAAWIVGLLMYLGVQLVASAVVGSVFARSVAVVVPAFQSGLPRAALLVGTFAFFAIINVRGGAKGGIRVVQAATVAKLVPLVIIVIAGLVAFRPEFVRWDGMPPAADVGRMAMRLIYLFAGIEAVLSVSGELTNPSKTVPRGLFLGLGICTVIYLGVQFAAQGLLGPDLPNHDQAPLADAAAVVLGPGGRTLMLLGAAISTLGFLSAASLVSPRTLYAMAVAGRLPRPLAKVHPRFGSPAVAIVADATAACLLAITGDFDTLTALSSSALLVIYLVCCAATIVLQRRNVGGDLEPLRLPGGPIVPVAAIAMVIGLMTTLKQNEVIALAVTLAAAIVAYYVSKARATGRPSREA